MNDIKETLDWLNEAEKEYTVRVGHEVDKVIKKALQSALDGGWMPIETAPKDGAQIILYKSPDKQCNMPFWVIGKFVNRLELLPYGQCYKGDDCCGDCPEPEDFNIKVLVTSWNHKDISSTGFTHWMPLPTPPQPEPQED